MTLFRFPRAAIAGAAFVLAMTPLAAQQPATPAAPPSIQAGQLIPIPEVTPERLAAARELVLYSGLGVSIVQVVPNLMGQINGTITRTRPELVADMKATLDGLLPEFMKLPDDMLNLAAKIYTAVLSEQETKEALAFFKSPTGMKFVESQPTVVGNLNPAVQNWSKEISVRMMDRVREEMKKKGHEI